MLNFADGTDARRRHPARGMQLSPPLNNNTNLNNSLFFRSPKQTDNHNG